MSHCCGRRRSSSGEEKREEDVLLFDETREQAIISTISSTNPRKSPITGRWMLCGKTTSGTANMVLQRAPQGCTLACDAPGTRFPSVLSTNHRRLLGQYSQKLSSDVHAAGPKSAPSMLACPGSKSTPIVDYTMHDSAHISPRFRVVGRHERGDMFKRGGSGSVCYVPETVSA